MDIRRFFDRFIDVTDYTDERLMQLLLEEKEREEIHNQTKRRNEQ
jgi:hypothetical protein